VKLLKSLKSENLWQSYKQERHCLVHFARLANTLLIDEENARDNNVLACNFAKYSCHVDTLPCNLSSMACFADINVSHGSVATYTRCSGLSISI